MSSVFFKTILILTLMVLSAFSQSVHQIVDEYILNGDFEEAEKIAQKAYAESSNDPDVICALACVYRNKSYKEILNVDAGAMGIKDGESGTYQIKDSTDLKRIISSVTVIDSSEFSKAEKLYFKILSIDSTYLNAYFNLLNTYVEIPDFEKYFKIIDLFIKNLHSNPDTKHYLLDFASKLMERKLYDRTIQVYNKILDRYPDFLQAKSDIGAVKFNQGKIIQAKYLFEEVYNSIPNDLISVCL